MKTKPKRRGSAETESDKATPVVPARSTISANELGLASGITILSVAVRELQYREQKPAPDQVLAPGVDVMYHLSGSFDVRPPYIGQVSMKVEVEPSQIHPVALTTVVTAFLQRAKSVPARDFLQYISARSGTFLFPYAREVISSTASRGVSGTIYLNPLILPPLLDPDSIDKYAAILEEAEAEMDAAGPIVNAEGLASR